MTRDSERALAFYRDTLGLTPAGKIPAEGGTMYMLTCGTSTIKIVEYDKAPPGTAPPGAIENATGLRYWTMSVSNIEEITNQCAAAGFPVALPVTEFMPGVRISIVEDPDGNQVEFLEM